MSFSLQGSVNVGVWRDNILGHLGYVLGLECPFLVRFTENEKWFETALKICNKGVVNKLKSQLSPASWAEQKG